MSITLNGTSGITTPGLNNSGALAGTTGTFSGLISANGGQIAFPATQNPSSDVNTLDDYEEGTWTPSLITDGSGASVTYTTQSGKYTKIGNCVTVECDLQWSARSGGSGNVLVAGFPFAITDTAYGCRMIFSYCAGTGMPNNAVVGYFTTPSGATSLYIYAVNSTTPVSSTSLTGAGGLAFKSHYYI